MPMQYANQRARPSSGRNGTRSIQVDGAMQIYPCWGSSEGHTYTIASGVNGALIPTWSILPKNMRRVMLKQTKAALLLHESILTGTWTCLRFPECPGVDKSRQMQRLGALSSSHLHHFYPMPHHQHQWFRICTSVSERRIKLIFWQPQSYQSNLIWFILAQMYGKGANEL